MNAEQIRAALSIQPELLALAQGLREKFGARLVWLKTPTVELGQRIVGAVRAI